MAEEHKVANQFLFLCLCMEENRALTEVTSFC